MTSYTKNTQIKHLEHQITKKEKTIQEQAERIIRHNTDNTKKIHIIADSNRTLTIDAIRKERPEWTITAPDKIFTTRQLVKHLDETPLSHNTTNIIMIGTNDIRLNNANDAIDNIKKIKKQHTPKHHNSQHTTTKHRLRRRRDERRSNGRTNQVQQRNQCNIPNNHTNQQPK